MATETATPRSQLPMIHLTEKAAKKIRELLAKEGVSPERRRTARGRARRRLLWPVLRHAAGHAGARPRQGFRRIWRAHFRGPEELSVSERHDARVRRDADAPGIRVPESERGAQLRLRQFVYGVSAGCSRAVSVCAVSGLARSDKWLASRTRQPLFLCFEAELERVYDHAIPITNPPLVCWNCHERAHRHAFLLQLRQDSAAAAAERIISRIFGLPRKLWIEMDALEQKFLQLSWKLHPDNFVNASEKNANSR